jgi:hypothetical protein
VCSIGLSDGDRLDLKFQAENRAQLERFEAVLRDFVPA